MGRFSNIFDMPEDEALKILDEARKEKLCVVHIAYNDGSIIEHFHNVSLLKESDFFICIEFGNKQHVIMIPVNRIKMIEVEGKKENGSNE